MEFVSAIQLSLEKSILQCFRSVMSNPCRKICSERIADQSESLVHVSHSHIIKKLKFTFNSHINVKENVQLQDTVTVSYCATISRF